MPKNERTYKCTTAFAVDPGEEMLSVFGTGQLKNFTRDHFQVTSEHNENPYDHYN